MRAIIMVELAVALLGTAAFIALYAVRSPWSATPMGRHLMLFAVVGLGELGSLLALGMGILVPAWMFAVGFAALDVVVLQRLWLLWRTQRSTE